VNDTAREGIETARIESLDWAVRPLKDSPKKLALVLGAACLAFALGLLFFNRLLMGVLGFAMILGSTMDHWLGASFHLDADRARSRVGASVTEMRWADVKRVVVGVRTVRLSPLVAQSRLEPFRGVLLKTEAGNHSEVLEFVRQRCPDGVSIESAATEAY
jgi:hypothetical protein